MRQSSMNLANSFFALQYGSAEGYYDSDVPA